MIHHKPIFDIDKVCKLYSEKDGVPVKYVCTSATNEYATFACDVFYRETPHPEFGNRYFAIFYHPMGERVMISNADPIEDLSFNMVYSNEDKMYHYSQHRHDFRPIPGESVSIDGGRSYLRLVGDEDVNVVSMKVKDGKFVEEIKK